MSRNWSCIDVDDKRETTRDVIINLKNELEFLLNDIIEDIPSLVKESIKLEEANKKKKTKEPLSELLKAFQEQCNKLLDIIDELKIYEPVNILADYIGEDYIGDVISINLSIKNSKFIKRIYSEIPVLIPPLNALEEFGHDYSWIFEKEKIFLKNLKNFNAIDPKKSLKTLKALINDIDTEVIMKFEGDKFENAFTLASQISNPKYLEEVWALLLLYGFDIKMPNQDKGFVYQKLFLQFLDQTKQYQEYLYETLKEKYKKPESKSRLKFLLKERKNIIYHFKVNVSRIMRELANEQKLAETKNYNKAAFGLIGKLSNKTAMIPVKDKDFNLRGFYKNFLQPEMNFEISKLIMPILRWAGNCKDLHILFDIRNSNINKLLFIPKQNVYGLTSDEGKIFLSYDYENPYNSLGTLIHELTHSAAEAFFKNKRLPYKRNSDEEKIFKEILNGFKKYIYQLPELFKSVFTNENCYKDDNDFMKELIVRIPHLLVLVGDIDKAKKQLEEIPDNLGISLFYFYIDKFLPEVEKNPNMSFEKNTSLHRLSAFAEDKVRDKELNDPRRYIQPTISSILKSKVGVEETKKFCQFSNKYNLGDQDPVIR